jgi:hypothetical protein
MTAANRLITSALIVVAIFSSGQARAAFIFDLANERPTTVLITGVIGFETPSGNSPADVTEFSVHLEPGIGGDPRHLGAP